MSRISDRISAAVSVTKCPGCGEHVVPQEEGCPKCTFPISRYQIRLKWIPWLIAGAALLVISILILVAGMLADLRGWQGWSLTLAATVGFVMFGLGLIGVIFGGAHIPGQSRQSSGWKPSSKRSDRRPKATPKPSSRPSPQTDTQDPRRPRKTEVRDADRMTK